MLPQSPRTSCAPLIFLGSDLRSQISCVRIDAWPCQAHSSAFEALWAAQTTQVCRFFALLGYHISPASSAASTRVESMSPPLRSPSLSLVAFLGICCTSLPKRDRSTRTPHGFYWHVPWPVRIHIDIANVNPTDGLKLLDFERIKWALCL